MFLRREHRDRPAVNRPARSRRSTRPQLATPEGRALLATYTNTSTADSGPGSLRYEIGPAESDSTNDTITTFNSDLQHSAGDQASRARTRARPSAEPTPPGDLITKAPPPGWRHFRPASLLRTRRSPVDGTRGVASDGQHTHKDPTDPNLHGVRTCGIDTLLSTRKTGATAAPRRWRRSPGTTAVPSAFPSFATWSVRDVEARASWR